MIEREIAQAAVEPGPGILDLAPHLMQAEEGFLHELLGHRAPPDQTDRKPQQPAFLGFKERGEIRRLGPWRFRQRNHRRRTIRRWRGNAIEGQGFHCGGIKVERGSSYEDTLAAVFLEK